MTLSVALALAVSFLGDVVHLRQGGRHEGRAVVYPRHVEVEEPGGRRITLLRSEVLRIDLEPNLIACPETVPFPADLPEKVEYDLFAHHRTLVFLSRPPGRMVAAFDVPTGKKLWELDLPNRVGEPLLAGPALYFMQREKTLDPKLQYRVSGAVYQKEIHRLTLTSVDLESGKVLLTKTFDNNDRKDLLWEFTPELPAIDVVPGRVVVRAHKQGYPMDASGNVNKGQTRAFLTLYSCEPREHRFIEAVDAADLGDPRARKFVLEDSIVSQTPPVGGKWSLSSFGLRDSKLRWKSEEFYGRLLDIVGDNAYVQGETHLIAISMKTGKKLEDWGIEHTGGEFFAIDLHHVYYFRRTRTPRAILGYDVKRAGEVFRIDVGERDDLRPLRFAGHILILSDRNQYVRAYDTLARKELWAWKAAGTGQVGNVILAGSGLAFAKDGRLFYLDLHTGRKVWEVKAPYTSLASAGSHGVVGFRPPATRDIVRRRAPPPPGAVFFAPLATPLRYAEGDEVWSPPAASGGALLTLSSSGACRAFEAGTGKPLWSLSVAPGEVRDPGAPVTAGGRLLVNANGATHVFDAASRAKLFQTPHAPPRPDAPVHFLDEGFLTLSGGILAHVELASGQKTWESKARGIRDFAVRDRKAFAVTGTEVLIISLNSGDIEEKLPGPGAATAVAIEAKKVFVAAGPGLMGECAPEREFREFHRVPVGPGLRFRGTLAAADGRAFFVHAGGELAAFDGVTGKTLWSFKAPEFISSLLVHGGHVWFAAAGRGLFRLRADSGAVEWTTEVPNAGLFTPFLLEGKPTFWSAEGWMVVPEK